MLILRDAFAGVTRFDEFQKSLGIAPAMLTRRLKGLVEAGLLERHPYSERPPRHEYRLTARGEDFRPVLLALMAWGNRHFAPEGESIMIVGRKTRETGATYLRLVGPTYGFFGLGLCLYFAWQGAGRLLWPLLAVGGGGLELTGSLHWVFAALGVTLVAYGTTVAVAIARGVWFRRA